MRVLVLGAGYAGLAAARRLERTLPAGVELVVVDESEHHVVRHEIHRLVRRPDLADDLRIPLRSVLDRAVLRRDRVQAVDVDERAVDLASGARLDFDYAAVCLGSVTADHGLPGVAEHGLRLETPADAARVREAATAAIESRGRIVVGGAGLTGVQVAGEIAELADEAGRLAEVDVVLVERLDSVAPGFPRPFREAIAEELAAREVEVRTGTAVEAATAETLETASGAFGYDAFVWTGGIRGPAAMGGERLEVPGTLRGSDGVFVVGDAARVVDRDGEVVPASAQAAVREGRLAARNVRRLVEADLGGDRVFDPRLDVLSFSPRGWVVSVGDGTVAQVGPTVLRGAPALAVKASVGLGYLRSVASIREAVELVVDEFGGDRPRRDPGG